MTLTQIITDVNQLQKQRLGYIAASLTNYDNDNEPQIAEGSKLEIGGALYEAEANESITGWGGIGASNTVYIKVVAATATIEFTTSAPTWSTSKQGWYDSLDRYIGGLYKDGSGNYSFKEIYGHRSAGGHSIGEVGQLAMDMSPNKLGCLWCDGSVISDTSNSEYARLVYQLKKEAGADAAHPLYHADADKATLPDFRGYAIRGKTGSVVSSRDQDGNRKVGHYQVDDNKSHTHGIRDSDSGGANNAVVIVPSRTGDWYSAAETVGSTEATMKNIAAYVLIKF